MAESLNDAVFWLPSQFLSDEDFFMTKEIDSFKNTTAAVEKPPLNSAKLNASLSFPTEFPYEFDSPGSTETETASDEEDFLAGLTRRLTHSSAQKHEKYWVESGSPESILSGIKSWSVSSNGSPNGSSPPTTPFGGQIDTWDLIYEAAGQVARMKMSTEIERLNAVNGSSHGRGLLRPANNPNLMHAMRNPNVGMHTGQSVNYNSLNPNLYQQDVNLHRNAMLKSQCEQERQQLRQAIIALQQNQQQHQIQHKSRNFCYDNPRCARFNGGAQPTWHQQPQCSINTGMRAVFLGGSGGGGSRCSAPAGGGVGVKRESTGTGVFLPRRYGNQNNNNNNPPRKKSAGCSTVLLPPKVVQALNLNFDDAIGHAPRYHSGFNPNYDAVMARRSNAILGLQKRSIRPDGLKHELHLPQDWTY